MGIIHRISAKLRNGTLSIIDNFCIFADENRTMSTSNPDKAIHPGILLRDELIAKRIKQIDFAATIGMPSPVLNDLLNGKRSITPDIAVILETAIGIDASTWLRLQSEKDIEISRQKESLIQKQKEIETWQAIQDCCNTSYLIHAIPGGLGKTLTDKIQNVLQFFHVNDTTQLKNLFIADVNPAFFRKSQSLAYVATDLFTWKQIAFNRSEQIPDCASKFKLGDKERLIGLLSTIFFENNNTIQRISDLLREFGIKFQIVRNEKGTHIDGFSFWHGNNPTITLTLRYHKIDILAFTLLHELGHLYNSLGMFGAGSSVITLSEREENIEEQEADTFAMNALIPQKEWFLFKARNETSSPYSMKAKILSFALQNRIHPAIVLGRYQHDTNIFDNGRGIDRAIL